MNPLQTIQTCSDKRESGFAEFEPRFHECALWYVNHHHFRGLNLSISIAQEGLVPIHTIPRGIKCVDILITCPFSCSSFKKCITFCTNADIHSNSRHQKSTKTFSVENNIISVRLILHFKQVIQMLPHTYFLYFFRATKIWSPCIILGASSIYNHTFIELIAFTIWETCLLHRY